MRRSVGIHNWTHKSAVVLVIVGALALILIPGFAVYNKTNKQVSDCRLEIVYKPVDTISNVLENNELYLSKTQVDSIIKRLEYHEYIIDSKCQALLTQRVDEEWFKDLFMYIIGVIAAILGFFGYRSFTDLEENALREENKCASKEVRDRVPKLVAKKVEKYLKKRLANKVNDRIDHYVESGGYDGILSEIRVNLLEELDKLKEEVLKELQTEIDTLKSKHEINGEDNSDDDYNEKSYKGNKGNNEEQIIPPLF